VPLEILMYFGVGFVLDICYTVWYAGIADKKILAAMVGSYLVTTVGYTLVYHLILGPDFFWHLQAFAIGCSLGTGSAMWYKKRSDIFKQ
jgi:hypothetical protein